MAAVKKKVCPEEAGLPVVMRRLLILGTVLVALVLAGAFVVRQALSGERLRLAAERRLSATLGQPVSIGELSVGVLPRISVVGRNVRVGEPRVHVPGLDIGSVRIRLRVQSWWKRDVSITGIDLDGFVVSVLRDMRGGWHVPAAVPAPSSGADPVVRRLHVTGGRVRVFDERDGRVVERSSIDELQADVSVERDGLRLMPVAGRIGGAAISGDARTDPNFVSLAFVAPAIADGDVPAFLRLLGSERPAFLHLPEPATASAEVQVDRRSLHMTGKGTLRAPQVLLDPLRLRHFEAPLLVKGTTLRFDPTRFSMYGGTYRGAVTFDLSVSPAAWTADSRVDNMSAGEFLKALTGRDQPFEGTASIAGVLGGHVGESLRRTLSGRLRVAVTNGVVRDFPLLATINRALRLAQQGSADTEFQRLAATLAVEAGQASTDDLMLEARDLRVEAAGRIGADRSLAFRGHGVIPAERVSRSVASIPELARLRNSRGEIDVPLTVSGSLDAPSIALDVKAAIRQGVADELRRRLRRIIRETP